MSACATACDGVVFSRASVMLRSPFAAVARAGSYPARLAMLPPHVYGRGGTSPLVCISVF